MAGKMHRQRRLNKPSRSWNILFYTDLIDGIQRRAEELSVTPSELVRIAVDDYLSRKTSTSQVQPASDSDFMEGIRSAAEHIKEDITSPRFPSGQTLGDRLADKIWDRYKESPLHPDNQHKKRERAD